MQIFDFGSACRGVVSKIREREACLATLRTQNSYDGESIFCYFSSFFFKRKTNREENVKSTSEGEGPEQNLTTPQFHHRLLEPAITAGSYDGGLHALARGHLCSQPHAMGGVGDSFQGEWEKRKADRIYCSSELLVLRWCIFVSARVLGSAYTSTTPKSK